MESVTVAHEQQNTSTVTEQPWQNMVSEMALSAIIQKHSSLPTGATSPATKTIIKSFILPSSELKSPTQTQLVPASSVMQQGYITVTQAGTGTVPIFAQNVSGGTQLIQGTPITMSQLAASQLQAAPELAPGQTPVVHLAPVQYATATATAAVDGTFLQQGFW